MGRGRAKAKQTKVARDLKYNTPHTDFSALQHELAGDQPDHGSSGSPSSSKWDDDDQSDTDDGYGYDDDRWASSAR